MGVEIRQLLNNYAIIIVPESQIDRISQTKAASCIDYVQIPGSMYTPYLTGRNTLVAVIDSGIDYFHEDFRNEDGTTKIVELWDQTLDRIFTQEEINEALAAGNPIAARSLVPSIDSSGHGTAVAGIAAGNGRESQGQYRGVAYESGILVVKLGVADPLGFPRTTELMRVLDYVVRYGVMAGQPVQVELSISPYETGLSVQLWKEYADDFLISLVTPSGTILGPLAPVIGPQTWNYEITRILLYYGEPSPYSTAQEIYFDFLPLRGDYLQSGIWTFRLTPQRIIQGNYVFWLPSSTILNNSTFFSIPHRIPP